MSFKKTGYKSVKSNVPSDWSKLSDREPIIDRENVAYGQIVRVSQEQKKITKIYKEDDNGKKVIDQQLFPDVSETAVSILIAYYDKEDTPENREIVRSNAIIQDVKVPPRPGSSVDFYVTVDAKAFDDIPARDQYTLQTVEEGETLHTLAEKYKNYLSAEGNSAIAKRARIAEILKANNISIGSADEQIVKDWIATVNADPARNISFKEGSEIYLPNIDPPDESHPDVKHIARLEVDEIVSQIESLKVIMNLYYEQIKVFNGKVENLDLKKEAKLLDDFRPSLRKHLNANDLAIKDIQQDEIDIGFDENYKPLFVTLDRSGERTPLTKGLIGLASRSPFDNPRTMALIAALSEISEIKTTETKWQEFVEEHIFPPVLIKSITPDNLFSTLTSDTQSVIDQLALRFDKNNVKSDRDIKEQAEALGDLDTLNAIAAQTKDSVSFTGDLTISNLSAIGTKIAANAGGAPAINSAFSLLLNKVSIKSLMLAAIKCLQAQVPFSCEDLVTGVIEANIEIAAGIFKANIPPAFHNVVDEALEFARTGDYEVFGEKSTEMEAALKEEDAAIDGAEGSAKFSSAFKIGLGINTPLGYEDIFEKICSVISNPIEAAEKFQMPLMNFPDDLITVDLQASVSASLEAAIIETIVGLILKLVETLINEITTACSTVMDVFPDIDFGNADLADAVAEKVGDANVADVLADLFDSLGGAPPIELAVPAQGALNIQPGQELEEGVPGPTTTEEISFIDLEPTNTSETIKTTVTPEKVANMKKLLDDLSAILTPSEITALFVGTASTSVLDIAVNVIKQRHPLIYFKVRTREDVLSLFAKLSKLAKVEDISEQVNTINKGLGCSLDDFCRRRDYILENVDLGPDDLEELIENNTKDRIQTISTLITTQLGGPLTDNPIETFCEERGSDVDSGLIPKDNASLIFLIKKVVNVMYDGIYMAFDDEIVKLPDALDTLLEIPKVVPRTKKQDWDIKFDAFDFTQLQEKEFTIKIPVPEGTPRRTIINPDFQRLLATGYVPVDGDPNGKYGPYTTEKIKAFGFLPTPFNSFPLPPVTVNDSLPITAANSRAGLLAIRSMKIGTESSFVENDDLVRNMYFVLNEPFKGQGFKPATFVLKYSLDSAQSDNEFKNVFSLKIGNVPIDPSTIPISSPPTGPASEIQISTPAISYAPMEAAVYHTRLFGKVDLNEEATKLIEYLEQKKGSVVSAGRVPQLDVFSKFVELIIEAGIGEPAGQLPQLPSSIPGRGIVIPPNPPSPAEQIAAAQEHHISKFVKNRMFDDLMLQSIDGIGSEILNSPLFKKAPDGTPFLKLIDFAPIPTEEERLCGVDPHILALDTVKKRTIEAYENYIKCSPLEDEISTDGLGRADLSSLEAAGMTGCVMTTLRAYALEQLVRAMYPVSVFAGEELISKLMVEYVVEAALGMIKDISESYYESFLQQVEVIFDLRMKEFNPFGSIPDVIEDAKELGIDWMYAEAAIKEFEGNPTGEETEPPPEAATIASEGIGTGADTGDCQVPGPPTAPNAPPPQLPPLRGNTSLADRTANRVRFLVEEQLYSVMPKLQDLICLDGTVSFDDSFLGRRLPLFDIQRQPGEVRFARVLEGSLKAMEQVELTRQYGEYLKNFQEFDNSRINNLLEAGLGSILDIASSVAVPATCLANSFGEISNSLDETVNALGSAVTDASVAAADAIEAAQEELTLDPTEGFGISSAFGVLQEEIPDVVTGGLTDTKEGLGKLVGTFDVLEECATQTVDGVVDTGKNVLRAVSDSPEPLETFVQGAAIGSTDKFSNIPEFSRGEYQTDFNLTSQNGGIILERYIKVKKRGFDSSILGTNIMASRGVLNKKQTSGPFSRSASDTGGDGKTLSQVLCPRERTDSSARLDKKEPLDVRPLSTGSVGDEVDFSLAPKINPEFETIYNIDDWEEKFAEEIFSNPDAKFEDLYESWTFGVRMVYVAPTNDFVERDVGELGTVAEPLLKVPSSRGLDAEVTPVRFGFDEEISKASKSFIQYEEIEVKKKEAAVEYTYTGIDRTDAIISKEERERASEAIENIDGITDFITAVPDVQIVPFPEEEPPIRLRAGGAFDVSPNVVDIKMERALVMFPLSEVEIPIKIGENVKLKNVLSSIDVGASGKDNINLQELWSRRFMGQLFKGMKSSPGYDMLFKYCTPSNTALSFAAIYANLLNEMPDYFFDKTKFELKKLFEVLLNGGDYTFEGEEEKKSGGNRGAAAQAKGNMGTSGDARKPGLFDLAIQTPKLIFKGLTEFIDPVIAISSAIVKAGKAGKLLPGFMKRLDEPEENYLLAVELGPYDLPPPAGSLPNPFGETEIPEYVPGHPDNINLELPMFEIKDAITGQSLSPFLQQHFFPYRDHAYDSPKGKLFREFAIALGNFNIPTMFQIILKEYLILMKECPESPLIIKLNGAPSPPVPTLKMPGDKLDLPLTPIAMSLLPMDVLGGYGPGPPHTPLGHIYHGLIAAEQLAFPNLEDKERQRQNAGFENKKKPVEKLCIDMDQIREEEGRRIAEDASKPIPKKGGGNSAPSTKTPAPPKIKPSS